MRRLQNERARMHRAQVEALENAVAKPGTNGPNTTIASFRPHAATRVAAEEKSTTRQVSLRAMEGVVFFISVFEQLGANSPWRGDRPGRRRRHANATVTR